MVTDGGLRTQKVPQKRSSSFKILVILSTSVFVFWMPLAVYYGLQILNVGIPYSQAIGDVLVLLFSVQCALDPIMFMFTLKGSKNALKRLLWFL